LELLTGNNLEHAHSTPPKKSCSHRTRRTIDDRARLLARSRPAWGRWIATTSLFRVTSDLCASKASTGTCQCASGDDMSYHAIAAHWRSCSVEDVSSHSSKAFLVRARPALKTDPRRCLCTFCFWKN